MNHGSLFSGIGGFDLAAEWMGWTNVFHCEWEEFPRKVLNYHFPKSISYGDIKETDFTIHRGQIDILTGGFPCQPYSAAGKRLGKEDERHLWPEMLRAIREIQPRWVVGENVRGIVNWNGGLVFEEVQTDLETEGYEVQPFILPAASVNAPHRRDRVWFVARKKNATDTDSIRFQHGKEARDIREGKGEAQGERGKSSSTIKANGSTWDATNTDSERLHKFRQDFGRTQGTRRETTKWSINREQIRSGQEDYGLYKKWQNFPTQPPVCGGNDGIPKELDGITFYKWRKESIKAYGNAIVPQVVYPIFKAIESYENKN